MTSNVDDPARCLVRTPRLQMRLLQPQDRAEFVRMHKVSRDAFEPWLPARPPGETTEQLFERAVQRAIDGVTNATEYRLVGLLDDGRMAGFFYLFQIVRGAFESAVASWAISAELMGRGLGAEGVGGMLDFAFAAPPAGLGLHRVAASIIPHNLASIRVAERNGFRREGLGVKYLKIAGRWQDHALYAKLVEEHRIRWIAQ